MSLLISFFWFILPNSNRMCGYLLDELVAFEYYIDFLSSNTCLSVVSQHLPGIVEIDFRFTV